MTTSSRLMNYELMISYLIERRRNESWLIKTGPIKAGKIKAGLIEANLFAPGFKATTSINSALRNTGDFNTSRIKPEAAQ